MHLGRIGAPSSETGKIASCQFGNYLFWHCFCCYYELSMFYCGSFSTMDMLTGADVHAQNCHFTCSDYIQPFFLGYTLNLQVYYLTSMCGKIPHYTSIFLERSNDDRWSFHVNFDGLSYSQTYILCYLTAGLMDVLYVCVCGVLTVSALPTLSFINFLLSINLTFFHRQLSSCYYSILLPPLSWRIVLPSAWWSEMRDYTKLIFSNHMDATANYSPV